MPDFMYLLEMLEAEIVKPVYCTQFWPCMDSIHFDDKMVKCHVTTQTNQILSESCNLNLRCERNQYVYMFEVSMEILTLYLNAGITPAEMLLHLDLMMLR